ncbi:hypothetical protein HDU76_005791 [Blyttiomyces sp. JEL0837]|nr:hypothetical protein HDU76_005791 [Blyttiomyces sp. JEL0837]
MLNLKSLPIQVTEASVGIIFIHIVSEMLQHCPNLNIFSLYFHQMNQRWVGIYNYFNALYDQLAQQNSLTHFRLLTFDLESNFSEDDDSDSESESESDQLLALVLPRSWTFMRNVKHLSIDSTVILDILIEQAPNDWWENLETLFVMPIKGQDFEPRLQKLSSKKLAHLSSLKNIEFALPPTEEYSETADLIKRVMAFCPNLEYMGLNALKDLYLAWDIQEKPGFYFDKSFYPNRFWAVYVESRIDRDLLLYSWEQSLKSVGLYFKKVDPFLVVPHIY